METDASKKIINIATPIVWSNPEMVNQYTQKLDGLIELVNERLNKEDFKIGVAIIDAYTAFEKSTFLRAIRSSSYCKVAYFPKTAHLINEMGYCWYKSVERAFNDSSFEQVHRVLYYPVDVAFERSLENTVSEPDKIINFLKTLQEGTSESEQLVMGNYISSDDRKNNIEAVIRLIIENEFPDQLPPETRVRSEYWGISPALFAVFKAFYFKEIHQQEGLHPVKDPSLLILLYCLRMNKKILASDLGKYKEASERNMKKRKNQTLRAVKLIYGFLEQNDFRQSKG